MWLRAGVGMGGRGVASNRDSWRVNDLEGGGGGGTVVLSGYPLPNANIYEWSTHLKAERLDGQLSSK